ncbi:LysR substrate-binding domain-containing protein [Verminephrobacter eiseniae]|uniref:Transcriptional regulator, LysR family n=1 Tax=Verminephrobacter eiseniae (strain EF01-2) TaxID=391735 RepID=A1WMR0_VEREI|nr:LysR substrate-binding domain-containing protein [Verminephrobacter eiseniae]ABM58917.1 transcriptional regulator, LysR family [Verminephrobacter eiseniae EF01-2]MCW5284480.1 LysR family transcriptional regulator [Verminephrobacter eiseniae]MCW5302186.1 LysR family transcriptional regulator [Verminephrobacter eiseniae]MCW8180400.1 LysR family transcriptional regulator [Verminephrobacter eiseniae]MCW8192270.1 LysR family transcriptional regulator [Verminephrobacter eiseniae]
MSGSGIQPADFGFFSTLATAGSLSAAARELGITTPAVSKHLASMESRMGVTLVNRTTRRMSLTPEGEVYLEHARRILSDIDGLEQLIHGATTSARGLLRVNATPGFGRSHIAPLVSKFIFGHPGVEVQLQLSVNPPPLTEDSFDVCIRFGSPPDARVIARHIAPNRRLLCASPVYIAKHGLPEVPRDLTRHNCIGIRQGDEAYGVWRLTSGCGRFSTTEVVKTRGNLTTNDGEIAVNWALDGHGILMRAEWDIERYLKSGRLVQVLPQCHTPDANIHAVYPKRHQNAGRVRAFVEFITRSLTPNLAP